MKTYDATGMELGPTYYCSVNGMEPRPTSACVNGMEPGFTGMWWSSPGYHNHMLWKWVGGVVATGCIVSGHLCFPVCLASPHYLCLICPRCLCITYVLPALALCPGS